MKWPGIPVASIFTRRSVAVSSIPRFCKLQIPCFGPFSIFNCFSAQFRCRRRPSLQRPSRAHRGILGKDLTPKVELELRIVRVHPTWTLNYSTAREKATWRASTCTRGDQCRRRMHSISSCRIVDRDALYHMWTFCSISPSLQFSTSLHFISIFFHFCCWFDFIPFSTVGGT